METPFPRKLRLLRKLKRCTQNSLAKALNVSRTTVSAWENRIAEPDLATLKNIRDYLKVSYEDLLDDWLRRTDKPFSVSGGCLKNPDKRRKPVPFKNRKNGIFLSWGKSDRKTATCFRLTRGIYDGADNPARAHFFKKLHRMFATAKGNKHKLFHIDLHIYVSNMVSVYAFRCIIFLFWNPRNFRFSCRARIMQTMVSRCIFNKYGVWLASDQTADIFDDFCKKRTQLYFIRTTSEFLSKGAEIAAIWQGLHYSCPAFAYK